MIKNSSFRFVSKIKECIYIYVWKKTLQLHGSFPILIERFSFSWHAKNDLDKNESKKQFLNRRGGRERSIILLQEELNWSQKRNGKI